MLNLYPLSPSPSTQFLRPAGKAKNAKEVKINTVVDGAKANGTRGRHARATLSAHRGLVCKVDADERLVLEFSFACDLWRSVI